MKTIFLTLFISSFLSVSLLASSDKEIKHTLLKYNYGIIKMGKSGETQFFREFVKKDVAMKLQVWFESWKFSNLTYIAKINDLRFSPIVYTENNATITTIENWTFSYVNLATKELAHDDVNIFYKMRYTLEKQPKGWMIVEVKHLQEKKIEKDSHSPSLEKTKTKSVDDNLQ
jgi:hypothetical protein